MLSKIDYGKLAIFITVNVALIGAIVILRNNGEVPDYIVGAIGTLIAALIGLGSSVQKDK